MAYFKKGETGNPSGGAASAAKLADMVRRAGEAAFKLLFEVVQGEYEATLDQRMAAARDILPYAVSKAKRQVEVTGEIEHTHTAHLRALQGLLGANGPMIDAKPLNMLDVSPVQTKHDISAPAIPDRLDVGITAPDGAGETVQAASVPPAESPPAPGTTSTGGTFTRVPDPDSQAEFAGEDDDD